MTQISKAAEKDIIELKQKIEDVNNGKIAEEKFKQFRLTRGVYGQRQTGVQMVRIKLPYGRVTPDQLLQIAWTSEEFSTGNLHLTTRQDIQLHYVKVEDSPQLWYELEKQGITLREACGNTVRNVTASHLAGIDPSEPFDVTPYAHAFAQYFLRNPICQDMGRKIKVSFSSNESDNALGFIHDIAFIPRVKYDGNTHEIRGFKVSIGGGLGAQAFTAQVIEEFIPEDEFIPFSEALIRVFDRYGERTKRMKARMKFLVKQVGLEQITKWIEEEKPALKNQIVIIDKEVNAFPSAPYKEVTLTSPVDRPAYNLWLDTNVFEQKQSNYYGVYVRIQLGDIHATVIRSLIQKIRDHVSEDIRITINQGLLLKFVRRDSLPFIFNVLHELGISKPGFDSIQDITSCPGTDTCNLGVASSTGLTKRLVDLLETEYKDLIHDTSLKIKISGCMNSCGQHMIANIGFHGSSIKNGLKVAPAMQVVLGGGLEPDGSAHIAEKVIKLPTKRIPDALILILNDYLDYSEKGVYFNQYYRLKGKQHFYGLLKPLADVNSLVNEDYIDWGRTALFQPEIGTGECAGVTLDVVSSILQDAFDKIEESHASIFGKSWADATYHAYNSMIIGAKAVLLGLDIPVNTQAGIVKLFDENVTAQGLIFLESSTFESLVFRIKTNKPTEEFSKAYLKEAEAFNQKIQTFRQQQLSSEKEVINHHYQA